jgi:Xaa-Pro aminopeptidase
MPVAVSRAKSYLKVRHSSVRKAMKALKLDAMLLTTTPDLSYLSGFTGDDSIGILTEKDFHLVTDFRYKEQAEIEAGWLKVHMREGKDVRSAGRRAAGAEGGARRL